MNLTDEERNDLAEVLSERLEGFPVRRATAEGAGMVETDVGGEPVHRWRLLVDRAIEKGKLIALLKSAANHSPGDTVLDKLVEGAERGTLILPELPDAAPPWRVLAFGGIGALVIVALIFIGLRFMDQITAWLPAWPTPTEVAPTEPVPEPPSDVEVRKGMLDAPKPARPVPHAAPAPEEPEPEPAPVPGRYIRIPDPSEAPAPAPAPAPP